MEIVYAILGFLAYTIFIGAVFYFCCKAANEVNKDDETF